MSRSTENDLGSKLLDHVKSRVAFCDEKQLEVRMAVFLELQGVLQGWVSDHGHELGGFDEALAQNQRARLLSFGSQRMGLVTSDSDIDAVCVVPRHVGRRTFFEKFPIALQKRSDATQLRVVEAAYVPVIKLTFQGIQFDLCLARLQLDRIPEDLDVLSLDTLRGLDVECVRSLNGVRETAAIMEQLPNFELFANALKIVKFWAKCKGIYGSSMGFLGGIGWTLALTYCCQKQPGDISLQALIQHFFHTWATWPWPQPILLKPLDEDTLNLNPWNPRMNTGDLHHVMPIITPAYPEHNCAFTVLESTKAVITQQFQAACTLIDDVMEGRAEPQTLFTPAPFTKDYRHFLLVSSKAKTYQEHVDWSGLVEAKLRLFVSSLEKNPSIVLAHPCTKTFRPLVPTPTGFQSLWLIGLQFQQTGSGGLNLDVARDIQSFNDVLSHAAQVRRFNRAAMSVHVQHVRRKHLEQHISKDQLF